VFLVTANLDLNLILKLYCRCGTSG